MSILLEALRKSEQKQRRGHVPTIHQAQDPVHDAPGVAWGRLAWLTLPVLALLAWFTWQQLKPPGVEPDPGTVTESDGPAEAAQVVARPDVNEGALTPTAADRGPDTAAEVASRNPGRIGSPVETLPAGPALSAKQGTAATTPQNAEPGPGVSVRSLETRDEPVEDSVATAGATQGGRPVGDSASAPAAEQEWRPQRPGPMSYWQLPENVRNEIGPLKVSVLVYDEDPAKRFILLNGSRAGEGDSPGAGLSVEEIQRGGVVFQYRLYRFLLQR